MKISKLESRPLFALSAGHWMLGSSGTKKCDKAKGPFYGVCEGDTWRLGSLKCQLKQTSGTHLLALLLGFCSVS